MEKVDALIVGLPRNAKKNITNIQNNIFSNFDVQNMVNVFSYEDHLHNPRSGDNGKMDYEQYFAYMEKPIILNLNTDLFFSSFSKILNSSKDPWNDNMRSVRNFLKYLKCLEEAYIEWSRLENPSKIVLVLRPDIIYADITNNLVKRINKEMDRYDDLCLTSVFQSFGGVNDRFAILKGSAIKLILTRIQLLNNYIEKQSKWNSEKFLADVISETSVKHLTAPLKLYRTRTNGCVVDEKFHIFTSGSMKSFYRNYRALI